MLFSRASILSARVTAFLGVYNLGVANSLIVIEGKARVTFGAQIGGGWRRRAWKGSC